MLYENTAHQEDFLPCQGPADSTKPSELLFTSWKYSFHLNYNLSIKHLSMVYVYTSLFPYFFFKNSWADQNNYLQTSNFCLISLIYFLFKSEGEKNLQQKRQFQFLVFKNQIKHEPGETAYN